jgi:hypothetical protein
MNMVEKTSGVNDRCEEEVDDDLQVADILANQCIKPHEKF